MAALCRVDDVAVMLEARGLPTDMNEATARATLLQALLGDDEDPQLMVLPPAFATLATQHHVLFTSKQTSSRQWTHFFKLLWLLKWL